MAITIISNPKDYAPVYNEMVYTLSSTNVAQTNFAFLVDIYINGAGTYTRLIIPPRPDNYGQVDIHRVLEASANSVLFDTTDTTDIEEADNSIVEYIVKFGEQYGATVTQYADLTVDSTRYAINASLERDEFIDYDWTDYTPVASSTTKKWLTNSPSTLYTSINDYGVLTTFNNADNDGFSVLTYDSAGSLNGFFSCSITSTVNGEIVHFKANPASLNNIDASHVTVTSGALPMIDSDVAYYEIYVYDTLVITQSTEKKTFYLRESCKNDLTRLIFLNKLGGWDSFNFYGASSETNDIERRMYKQNPDRVDGSGNYTYSKSDREKIQYYTKTKKKLKVYSDWITEEEDAWLLELIESPEIYLQSGSELISIANIDLTSHKKRKSVTDKIFNLELTLEFGYDNYRQRG